MNKNDILMSLGKVAHKTGFMLKKHSPEICQGVGIIGMCITVVLACKATTKLPEKTELFKKRLDHVKNEPEPDRKMVVQVYGAYAWDLAKLYGPSAMLGVASLTSMSAATQILRNRNAGLAAAYAAVDSGFKKYRAKVAEKFGEEVDKQILHGAKEETFKEKEVGEDGKEHTVKKTRTVLDSKDYAGYSPYAIFFDETNPLFQKLGDDPELIRHTLVMHQKFFNDRLRSKGYVFLNEVYKALGAKETKAGQVVGWVYDENNPIGDNYIDFGIYDVYHHPQVKHFINGNESAIILDFNVDGYILDYMA